ncbi:MAG: Fic family protein [Bacilli bacterium]|nr:Fic family protein [Bacilli bacterium]
MPKVALPQDFLVDFSWNSLTFDNTKNITKEDVEAVYNGETEKIDKEKAQIIVNHKKALEFIVDLINQEKVFTEDLLKDTHQILMESITEGGLYRNVDIRVNGSSHTPPSHLKVYDRMKKLFETIDTPTDDPLYLAVYVHLQLYKIHPFLDGNGRLARLVLNYILLKNQLSPIIFKSDDYAEYFRCMEEFKVNKDIEPFLKLTKSLI